MCLHEGEDVFVHSRHMCSYIDVVGTSVMY